MDVPWVSIKPKTSGNRCERSISTPQVVACQGKFSEEAVKIAQLSLIPVSTNALMKIEFA